MNLLNVVNNLEIRTELESFILNKAMDEEKIICSIVYKFAKKLPYSMDYKDENFIPCDFFNFTSTIKNNSIFKYHDNLYSKMISWSDTFKSGILIQICLIFQKMLLEKFPNDYKLTEDDYYNLGINNMTDQEEYNRYFFEILKELPEYYKRVNDKSNQEERREVLDELYIVLKEKVGNKVGGYRKTESYGNVEKITESKATINWSPYRDLEMLYYFNNMDCYDVDCNQFINNIKGRINALKNSKQITKKLK